ncbi:cytochrome b/b6/petB-domain-containing protein [Pelagophyceae sp. CCMP2097]|nr:cytochrome b/b6/petB-domain-containing protein [Pelagophyceae sp. CCMP2097]|mmetsp:Transcript_9315/g.32146  ORF Transcript_9315/g.32146 Transcript_9315/m.32146 type:complete len:202 (+) Transcript_9315:39-644(+)
MSLSRNVLDVARRFSTAPTAPEVFSVSVKAMHWGVGVGILGCFGTVQAAMYTTKDYKPIPGYVKGDLMNLHKSFGLLIGAAVVPRLAVRALSTAPAHLPGPYLLNLAADASHVLKYALMIAMPATGIAMGYFGGKGLPFFGYTIPGASAENKNGKLAGQAFWLHKNAGQIFEYTTLLHVGAAGLHVVKGQAIFRRIVPGLY